MPNTTELPRKVLKTDGNGNFLAVQWSGLYACPAWSLGSIPGPGTKILQAKLVPKNKQTEKPRWWSGPSFQRVSLSRPWDSVFKLPFGEGNGNPLRYSCLENPMNGGAWWLQSMGSLRVGHDWVTSLTLLRQEGLPWWLRGKECLPMQEMQVQFLGGEESPREGNGNPLQYSCLENPMDEEVWWATVHGVTKSWTQLSD